MASPQINMRWPTALIVRVDAQCARRGLSRTEYALEALESFLAADEEAAEAPTRGRKQSAPAPGGKPPRDLSPRLKAAPSDQTGRGSGMVSGLSLPVGNQRGPMPKGQPKAKR